MLRKLSSISTALFIGLSLVASWLFNLRPVSAADIIVNPGESIQAAIDSASPGDTIIIQPGIYTEALTLNKAVSLTGVSSDTVILVLPPDSPFESSLLTIDGPQITTDVVIAHLTFHNSNSLSARGINISNFAQPTLHHLTIRDFFWGIMADEEDEPTQTWPPLTIEHLSSEQNNIGIWSNWRSITVTNSSFDTNNIIFESGDQATIRDSHISIYGYMTAKNGLNVSNMDMSYGDFGLYSNGHISLTNSTVRSNDTFFIKANSGVIQNSIFENNELVSFSEDCSGFCVPFNFTNTLHLLDSTIVENHSENGLMVAQDMVIQNSLITSNTFTDHAGYIYGFNNFTIEDSDLINNPNALVYGGNLTIRSSNLTNNGEWRVEQNGLITNSHIISGLSGWVGQDLTVIDSTLSGHTQLYAPFSEGDFSEGYGVFQVGGSAYISNSHITNNLATQCNGSSAFYLYGFGNATILDSTFANNRVDCPDPTPPGQTSGAAVVAGNTTIANSHFINNQATGHAYLGAAVAGFEVDITDSYFAENNNVEQFGFAIYANQLSLVNSTFISHTGQGCVLGSSDLTIDQTEFTNNQTDYAVICGPDVPPDPLGFVHLNQSRFINNQAPAVVSSGYVTIANSLFAHNTPAEPNQPIIQINEGHLTLHHNTIAHETLLNNPAVLAHTSSITVVNNIISNFEIGLVGENSTLWEDYNLLNNSTNINWDSPIVSGPHTLLNLNPGFTNPAGNNFSLLPDSPAVDAGLDLGYFRDLEGNPRWLGTAPDLGALEHGFAPTLQFSQPTYTTTEEAGSLWLTVALSETGTQTVTVQIYTAAGSALPSSDYQPFTHTLVFAPGQLTHTVAITLVNDELPEPTEWLTVTLANPAGAVLGTPAHTRVHILDTDNPPPVFHHIYLPVLLRP